MPSLGEIQLLVHNIISLACNSIFSAQNATKYDKIYKVMHTTKGKTPHKTFNCRFDALFGEDCCNSSGHLHYIHKGKHGMDLVCKYLSEIDWSNGFPLDLVEIKLKWLSEELKILLCVSIYFSNSYLMSFQASTTTIIVPNYSYFEAHR